VTALAVMTAVPGLSADRSCALPLGHATPANHRGSFGNDQATRSRAEVTIRDSVGVAVPHSPEPGASVRSAP
jgi:hypothetical protein